ncbi:streptococcal 67 kDa myosin-cross-reactive antigen like family-domain-containing protein [Aspergillus heterothallicus]
MSRRRDPDTTHAWIVGSDLSSLAAAVYLIHDAHMPGPHIHLLFDRARFVPDPARMEFISGSVNGCTAHVLSCVSGYAAIRPDASILDELFLETARETASNLPPQSSSGGGSFYSLRDDGCGIRKIQQPQVAAHLRLPEQRDLVKVMLDDPWNLRAKSISQCFRASFFNSDLWLLFSTRFALRPCHSAMEFQKCLCKYIEDARADRIDQPVDSRVGLTALAETLGAYLHSEGVDFWPNTQVPNLKLNTAEAPLMRVLAIEATDTRSSTSQPLKIPLQPEDILLVALGSADSGSLMGSNGAPPPPTPVRAERILNASWSLWFRIAHLSPDLGDPAAFCTHLSESKLEVFTVILDREDGDRAGGGELYAYLSDRIGEGSTLAMQDSNWSLRLCVSRRGRGGGMSSSAPGAAAPPPAAYDTIWGYGLTPEQPGNFMRKPMCCCAGQEILSEVLSHLASSASSHPGSSPGFDFDETLSKATTIPCMLPLGSAALVRRNDDGDLDQPCIVPQNVSNMALIGPFARVPEETVCGLEYGIRSAQIAVDALMGLHLSLPKVRISALAKRYGKGSH